MARCSGRLAFCALTVLLPLPAQISGQVVLAGGGAPPQPAFVAVRCEGTQPWAGYTNKKGEFLAYMRVGEVGDGITSTEATADFCRVEATLEGYAPAGANVTSRAERVLLTLRPMGTGEAASVSYSNLKAPPAARKLFEEGTGQMRARRWLDAENRFRKAVQTYPEYSAAWTELGAVSEKLNKPVQAREAYEKALAADSHYLPAYTRLAVLHAGAAQWSEVARITGDALALNPTEFPSLFFYNAVANYNLHRLDPAEQSARRAIQLDGGRQLPRAEYVLGCILAERRDYRGAVEHMSRYLELLPTAADAPRVRSQIAESQSHLAASP
jgi:tetratricopeptide (TPR) repeat protein